MTTMTSALRAIGGGAVTEVIPASAIALAGLGSGGVSGGGNNGGGTGGNSGGGNPSERPNQERLISLG